jgi:hypothetical protein
MTGFIESPLFDRLNLVAAIVVTPPIVLLAVGALSRLIFETISAKLRNC